MKIEDILNLEMLTDDDKAMLFHMVQAKESLYGIIALTTAEDMKLEKAAKDAAEVIENEMAKRYADIFRWDRLISYYKGKKEEKDDADLYRREDHRQPILQEGLQESC